MKKWIALLLSIFMVFALAACGNTQKESGTTTGSTVGSKETETSEASVQPETSAQTETESSDENEPEESEGGKVLIVYYSATGNTEEVANYIARATGADLFELVPTQTYSADDLNWSDHDSRVCREHDNPEERVVPLVADTVENWDSYDTVFIGYPIWWGIAAWPVDGFISANDFTGKTVIPFCTSSSSGLGESGKLLEEAAGTGEWLEGIRFGSGASEETVIEWVKSLGL